jgi:hypothetical protein
MSIQDSQYVFPFRAVSLFSLYMLVNTICYNRESIGQTHVTERAANSILLNPGLPPDMLNYLSNGLWSFPQYVDYVNAIRDWTIAGDIFLAFLFAAMILGLLGGHPHLNFFIGFLHFIGVLLVTHVALEAAPAGFFITGIVFGVLLPIVVEIWNVLALFVFKKDFYFGIS